MTKKQVLVLVVSFLEFPFVRLRPVSFSFFFFHPSFLSIISLSQFADLMTWFRYFISFSLAIYQLQPFTRLAKRFFLRARVQSSRNHGNIFFLHPMGYGFCSMISEAQKDTKQRMYMVASSNIFPQLFYLLTISSPFHKREHDKESKNNSEMVIIIIIIIIVITCWFRHCRLRRKPGRPSPPRRRPSYTLTISRYCFACAMGTKYRAARQKGTWFDHEPHSAFGE